ncbi:MAG: methionine biosynthesis protein MetW [Phycisphaerae bacterium]|nr:methionine biosynthesis protein MetW [Phycisphaerae bacterium]
MSPRLANHHSAATLYDAIIDLIPAGAKVLDLGCGDGELLRRLMEDRGVTGMGVEIDTDAIVRCVEAGVDVIQSDLDRGIAEFADDSYDVVVLNMTLQVTRRSDLVLREAMRVGRKAIVTIPNFGYWRLRQQLVFWGRMPVSRSLPYPWYETPNIRVLTIKDFRRLARKLNGVIEREIYLRAGQPCNIVWPNFLAPEALFVIRREA